MNSNVESTGLSQQGLVEDSARHLELWREHDVRQSGQIQLEEADFRGLVFRNHRFRNQSFLNCDFSGSRWLLAGMQDADCSGSNFSGITTMWFDLQTMDCTGCNFSNATLWFGFNMDRTKFCGADFSGATLRLSEQFHKSKEPPDFTGAIMNGCTFINESRYERGALDRWFSESQRAVMKSGPTKRSNERAATPSEGAAYYPFWDYSAVVMLIFFAIAALVLATLVGKAVIAAFHFEPDALARRIVFQSFGYVLLLAGASALFRRRYGKSFVRGVGFVLEGFRLRTPILLGGILAVVTQVASAERTGSKEALGLQSGWSPFWLVALAGIGIAPFVEEAFFRGLLQPLVVRSLGAVLGVAIPAFLYSTMLLPQYGWSRGWASLLVASTTWGWIRHRTDSTTAAAVAHASYNATVFGIALLFQGAHL
jgi:uncharacterized protein YjbI with pentapeptide repeats/membrane protease YdiL (CAAX protease family)